MATSQYMNKLRLLRLVRAHFFRVIVSVVIVGAFATAGYFALRDSHAATYAAASEAENGVISGNASSLSVSGASGGSAVNFGLGGSGSTSTCPLPKYPSTACTGVPAGTSLATVNGDVTLSAGQTLDGKRVTGKVYVNGSGATIKNSEIYGGVTNSSDSSGPSFTVTDTTIGAPSGCNGDAAITFNNYTATRVYIRNFGDGPRDSGDNILLQDSYVQTCSNPGDHADGFQGYLGGANVRLIHNTIDVRASHPDVTAPIFIADGSRGITAQDNLLAGGSFTVRIYGTSQTTFSNNKIVNSAWIYGPVSSDCSSITWSNNSLVNIDSNYNVTSTVSSQACVNGN